MAQGDHRTYNCPVATPVRKQYLGIKARYPDSLLLFRMGDFYETFDEDARIASRDLEIVLTQRDMGQGEIVPLAGIPYHALDSYLARLIRAGHRVAICEQISEPDGKRLVDRQVVRVVTPGTVLENALLDSTSNNYLAAVFSDHAHAGVAYVDVSTGEFSVTEIPKYAVSQEISRLNPSEILISEQDKEILPLHSSALVSGVDRWVSYPEEAHQQLLAHFKVTSLEPFDCEHLVLAYRAAAAIVAYLQDTHPAVLTQLNSLKAYTIGNHMVLDPQTRRNLELFEGGRWASKQHSLFSVLNVAETPMGARLLRNWIGQPLRDIREIERRLDSVEALKDNDLVRRGIRNLLNGISDLERIVNRAGAGVVISRELVSMRESLEKIPELKDALLGLGAAVTWIDNDLMVCREVVDLLSSSIFPDPQGDPGHGNTIKEQFSPELDELRNLRQGARSHIVAIERRERSATGIPTLKVGYNRVFGYYIEVTNPHLDKIPTNYVRRQTLTGGERFYTPELKELEDKVLHAAEQIEVLERSLYRQVCSQVAEAAPLLNKTAISLATVDAIASLAETAANYGYVRPTMEDGGRLKISAGRHPVVERSVPAGQFVPNDTFVSTVEAQLLVLTGPNMAGKSTYLRQTALIVLMAQIGSFVPAKDALIGVVDRIFTRVGAQDDLSVGQSTFMVEMLETAQILNQATSSSLVVLDEIGRGTSTYDGLSIAQAVAEHLHDDKNLGCRTLFATHYHELTALADWLPGVSNASVAVADQAGEVVFLHKIVPGGADRSYGVHVAELAGLPSSVTARASQLLAGHEQERRTSFRNVVDQFPVADQSTLATGQQLNFLDIGTSEAMQKLLDRLLSLETDTLTPLQALNALHDLQQGARDWSDRTGGNH